MRRERAVVGVRDARAPWRRAGARTGPPDEGRRRPAARGGRRRTPRPRSRRGRRALGDVVGDHEHAEGGQVVQGERDVAGVEPGTAAAVGGTSGVGLGHLARRPRRRCRPRPRRPARRAVTGSASLRRRAAPPRGRSRRRQREHQGVAGRVVAGTADDLHGCPGRLPRPARPRTLGQPGPGGTPSRHASPPTTTITAQAYRAGRGRDQPPSSPPPEPEPEPSSEPEPPWPDPPPSSPPPPPPGPL